MLVAYIAGPRGAQVNAGANPGEAVGGGVPVAGGGVAPAAGGAVPPAPQAAGGGLFQEIQALLVGFFTSLLPGTLLRYQTSL